MKLSVVIPVYNEEQFVGQLLHRVKKELQNLKSYKNTGIHDWEIIIVDDGSTDESVSIIKSFLSDSIKLFQLPKNKGKGAALKEGFNRARGDMVLIQDADLEYNPIYYPELIKPIVLGETQIVYGTRLRHIPLNLKNLLSIRLPINFLTNKGLSAMASFLFGVHLTDMETGYKVLTKEVLETITVTSDNFDIDVEMTGQSAKHGFRIIEVDIDTIPRGYDEGKKIGVKDGFQAIGRVLSFRLDLLLSILGVGSVAGLLHFWNFPRRYIFTELLWQTISLTDRQNSAVAPMIRFFVWLADFLPWILTSYWLISGISIVMSSVVLIVLSWHFKGQRAAFITSLLSVTSLLLMQYHFEAAWQSLVVMLISVFFFSLYRLYKTQKLEWLSLSALLLGILFLTSSITLVILLPVWFWFVKKYRLNDEYLALVQMSLVFPLLMSFLINYQTVFTWIKNIPQVFAKYIQFTEVLTGNHLVDLGNYIATSVGGSFVIGASIFLVVFASNIYLAFKSDNRFHQLVVFQLVWLLLLMFLTPLNSIYVAVLAPILIVLSAITLTFIWDQDEVLGGAVLVIVLLGNILSITENTQPLNKDWSLSIINQSLVANNQAESYQVFDYQAQPSVCSKSIQYVLFKQKQLRMGGTSIGACLEPDCPKTPELFHFNTTDGICRVRLIE